MSQDNVLLVREFNERFNAFMRSELPGDVLADLFDPDIEMNWHGEQAYPDVPQHLCGVSQVAAWAEQYRSAWADVVGEPLEIIDAPADRILSLIRLSSRGRHSGVPLVVHFLQVFTIRDGKPRKIEFFRHRDDALKAAGLRE